MKWDAGCSTCGSCADCAPAQLIGGEVSLLDPEDHAAALALMHANGREPMSMTHGDFDCDYLLTLVLDAEGRRFDKVSFAAHFDSLMRGRRGAVRPRSEAELDPCRRGFTEMFADLRRDHGVGSYPAHNMTVTPANLHEVPAVTRSVLGMPYDMLAFQPAAFLGDDRRWKEDFGGQARPVLIARLLRAALRHPGDVPVLLGVARRMLACRRRPGRVAGPAPGRGRNQDLRGARLHGRLRRGPRPGPDGKQGRTSEDPGGAGGAGAPGCVHVHHGPLRDGTAGAGLHPALRAGSRRERAAAHAPADHGRAALGQRWISDGPDRMGP